MRRAPYELNLFERIQWYGWTVTVDDCWEFEGPKAGGYGVVCYSGEDIQVHRAAYEFWVGPIPEGHIIRHYVCDNPPCMNPAHLRSGTHQENMLDMVESGRSRRNDKHHNVKLSQADVREIKELSSGGLLTQYMIAEVFGTSQSHVSGIVSGTKREYA